MCNETALQSRFRRVIALASSQISHQQTAAGTTMTGAAAEGLAPLLPASDGSSFAALSSLMASDPRGFHRIVAHAHGPAARTENLVPELVPVSADPVVSQRTEAEPKPRFCSQTHSHTADLKTVGRASAPWVRIPAPPLNQAVLELSRLLVRQPREAYWYRFGTGQLSSPGWTRASS